MERQRHRTIEPITPEKHVFDVEKIFNQYVSDLGLSEEDVRQPLLDVGTNTGAFVEHVRTVLGNKEAYGVERYRQRTLKSHGSNDGTVIADGFKLPFRTEQFNLVVCHNAMPIFYSNDEPGSIIDEMLRVSKLGGRIVFNTSTPEHIRRLVEMGRPFRGTMGPGHSTNDKDLGGVESFYEHIEKLKKEGYIVSSQPSGRVGLLDWLTFTIRKPKMIGFEQSPGA